MSNETLIKRLDEVNPDPNGKTKKGRDTIDIANGLIKQAQEQLQSNKITQEQFDLYINQIINIVKNKKNEISELLNAKFQFINDIKEQFSIPKELEKYDNIENGSLVYKVKKDGKFGLVEKLTLREIIKPHYDFISTGDDSEGFYRAEKDGKYGFIDGEGNEVINFIYDEIKSFSEGLAAVKKNGTFGYINNKGKTTIDYKYHTAETFYEGLAIVSIGHSYGFIDKNGDIIIELKYRDVKEFSGLYAEVRTKGGDWIKIDKKGNECKN